MTTVDRPIRLGAGTYQANGDAVGGGFATIDGERFAAIRHVDRMDPFLMSIVSDSDTWLFVGSNGPFTAGRGSPDSALFPYQTVDKILRHPTTSGARTSLLVTRDGSTALWEPWLDAAGVYRIERHLYKRIDSTAVVFEEINHDLGVRFRWRLSATERFGLVRRAELSEIAGAPLEVRYLDGFHEIIPPGVDQDTYARLSYLATAYMRHERLPGVPLAVYSLNAAISDRAEPSESLRVAGAWSVGHPEPVILLSDRQVEAFRRGDDVVAEAESRGTMGAYLAMAQVALAAGGRHAWATIGDTRLNHPDVIGLRDLLAGPGDLDAALRSAEAADRAGVRRRVAGSDGLQQTADEAATANHRSNVLFNIMRGGSFDGERIPRDDLGLYLAEQDRVVLARHRVWLDGLPEDLTIEGLRRAAAERGDPQLIRLVRSYLPLTYSRRHGDPSRPWNRFFIRVRDERGRPVYGYQGNWRDIFQNWEALGRSYPQYLAGFVSVFLDASTADGYNPYRIARAGVDWEVEDPRDPWSHIGYWGDHQIVYLLRLLEALEAHWPGALADALDERIYAYASVPYRIGLIEAVMADPRETIDFDRSVHDALLEAAARIGADGKLLRDPDGEVVLVTLAEKLLVPLLVKLTNLVPDGGIWLNTQRPEWNDANNALAGWGLSVVTLSAIHRYLGFLDELVGADQDLSLTAAVASLLASVTTILADVAVPVDDATRYRVMLELGRAGDEHRRAAYSGDLGETVAIPTAAVRALIAAAGPVVAGTLRSSRRDDALYHSYNLLRIDGEQASVHHLGPMLEGQVAILDSGLLGAAEAIDVLRALRAGDLYRADQHTYLLYPDRALTPFLERNRLEGRPPLEAPSLFVEDRDGTWHFQADLSTAGDVERELDRAGADPAVRQEVLDLWRTTFAHDEFTGRSGTFFMFEGLGSVYWHMIAKLLLAVQGAWLRATDPADATALAEHYHDVRDGLGFRRSPLSYGAFPTDPYSHTPRHHGAQQPGMTGQVKEQILTRLGELGLQVVAGRLRFEPRLVGPEEWTVEPTTFDVLGLDGTERTIEVPPRSLALTFCQVPVVMTIGGSPSIELHRKAGGIERVGGLELDQASSAAVFGRTGAYREIRVTVPTAMIGSMDAPRG